jgi:hypothetical protein
VANLKEFPKYEKIWKEIFKLRYKNGVLEYGSIGVLGFTALLHHSITPVLQSVGVIHGHSCFAEN